MQTICVVEETPDRTLLKIDPPFDSIHEFENLFGCWDVMLRLQRQQLRGSFELKWRTA